LDGDCGMRRIIQKELVYQLPLVFQTDPKYNEIKRPTIEKLTSLCWWLNDNLSLINRGLPSFSNLKKLMRNYCYETIINNRQKLLPKSVIPYILLASREAADITKDQLYNKIPDNLYNLINDQQTVTIDSLITMSNLDEITIKNQIKGLMKQFRVFKQDINLLKSDNQVIEEYLINLKQDLPEITNNNYIKLVILEILSRYPLLTIEGLSKLSLINKFSLGRQLHELTVEGKIIREIYVDGVLEERFLVQPHLKMFFGNQEANIENFNNIEIQSEPKIFHKTDPLVEILPDYILNIVETHVLYTNGVPVATFKLIKSNKQAFDLKKFQLINEFSITQELCFEAILKWSQIHKIKISLDNLETPQGRISKSFVNLLSNRGYKSVGGRLILSLTDQLKVNSSNLKKTSLQESQQSVKLSASLLKKYSSKEILEFVKIAIFIPSPEALILRLHEPQVGVKMHDSVKLIIGFNGRLGYIHEDHIPYLIALNQTKAYNLRTTYFKLLSIIKKHETISFDELSKLYSRSERELRLALNYLESKYYIMRCDLIFEQSVDIVKSQWQIFPERYKNNSNGDQFSLEEAERYFILKLLEIDLPLSVNQISRFLGFSFKQITNVLQNLINAELITEGYFTKSSDRIEYLSKSSEFHESLSNLQDGIMILSTEDPVSTICFTEFLQRNSSIIPQKPFTDNIGVYLSIIQSDIIGYLVWEKISKDLSFLNLKLVDSVKYDKSKIFAIFNEFYYYTSLIYKGVIKLQNINNTPVFERDYESLHFGLEALGYVIVNKSEN
jgi:hypothetical protein